MGNAAKGYAPTRESRTLSLVFPSEEVHGSQYPAVYAKAAEGRVGYIGDVNGEEGGQKFDARDAGFCVPSCTAICYCDAIGRVEGVRGMRGYDVGQEMSGMQDHSVLWAGL